MKTPTRQDFEARLQIDRNNLDQELVEQPELYYRICEQYALAVSHRDQLHDGYKEVQAGLNIRLRRKMEEKGDKVTVAGLDAAVASHAKFLEAKAEHAEAAKEAELWVAMKDSFQQRAWVLKDLTQLYISGYFQNNSAGGSKHKVDEVEYQRNREKLAHGRREHL